MSTRRIVDVRPGETDAQALARHAVTRIQRGMSRADYDRLTDRVNWSTLKWMGKSPAHYRERVMRPGKDSAARRRGRVLHLAVFEPERFPTEVAVWTEGRRYGKKWDQFVEDNADRELLNEEEHDRCMAIQRAVRSDPVAGPYLQRGASEVTVLWRHDAPAIGATPGYSVECKSRLDFESDNGALVDLKSTRDASPDGFGREVWRYRYDGQAGMYMDGYREASGGSERPYVFVAVEPEPPYAVQVYRATPEMLELGREHYRGLLARLAVCRAENRWPGYLDGESDLLLPRWSGIDTDGDDLSGMGLVFESETEAA